MKRIFDYGGRLAERVVTVAELQVNTEPHRYSMTSPVSAEEAADAAAAGIHAFSIWDTHTAMIREAAPTQFICAAQSFTDYATHDDILRGAMSALDAGADVIYTARGPDVVEMLASQGIAVQGHLGLVPRMSTRLGGLRAVGKTAEEVVGLINEATRFEDAGGVMMEAEVVTVEVMRAVIDRSGLIFSSLGSGTDCDIVFQFMEDICGEKDTPYRHARAFGDVGTAKARV